MAAAVGCAAVGGGAATAENKPAKVITTTVRGGWLNDAACVPTGGGPTANPDVFTFTCHGTSTWNGHFSGKTVIDAQGTANVRTGAMRGTFTETFYGTFVPDRRSGALMSKGSFAIVDNNFIARSTFTGGTCGFAGSSGTLAFDGFVANGGYVGRWTRPATPPPSTPCAAL